MFRKFSFLTISSHSKWTAIIAAIMSNRQIRSSFHGFWLNNLNCVCANLILSDTQFVLISAHCYSYNWNCFGKMLLSAILYPNRVWSQKWLQKPVLKKIQWILTLVKLRLHPVVLDIASTWSLPLISQLLEPNNKADTRDWAYLHPNIWNINSILF